MDYFSLLSLSYGFAFHLALKSAPPLNRNRPAQLNYFSFKEIYKAYIISITEGQLFVEGLACKVLRLIEIFHVLNVPMLSYCVTL